MVAVSNSITGQRAVYLVRHATPDWTRSDIPYHLPPGPPLVEQGKNEAILLRTFLRKVGVHLIAASPLERCQQTAHLVADLRVNGHVEAAIPIETWPALMELQPGEETASMRSRFWPSFLAAWAITETMGSVAVVTHGGSVNYLLEELGVDPDRLKNGYEFDHHNPIPTAGAWRVTRTAHHLPWQMELVFIPADPAWQSRGIEIGWVKP
jgi:broad specificity phosphatase PhoE